MAAKKVLIVEDNLDLLDMYRFKFEKEGFEVKTCEDGFAAVQTAVDFKPDVILLDIMMPNMDGFETLKVIKTQTEVNTKIVMFSNLSSQKDIDRCLELWADDYLVKSDTTPSQAIQKVKELSSDGEIEANTNNSVDKKTSTAVACPHCGEKINIDLSTTN